MWDINIKTRENLGITDLQFLSAFCNENETMYFRMLHDQLSIPKNEECKLEKYNIYREIFKDKQSNGYGIFFVVNRGGQKKAGIKRLTSQFLDFDFGKIDTGKKDQEGKTIFKYRTKEELERLKQEFLTELKNFKLEPSIVVETKNGFHVYWLLKEGQAVNKFKSLEERMIEYFAEKGIGVDGRVKDLCHVLRVIEFIHQKNPKDPFRIKCVKFDINLKYAQEEIADAINVDFNSLVCEDLDGAKKKNSHVKDKIKETKPAKKVNNKENNKVLKNDDVSIKKSLTNTNINEKKVIYSYKELFDYLKRQDLREYLDLDVELNKAFCCIFHHDTRPSAAISKTSSGYYKYFCNSTNCDYNNDLGLDIVNIVQKKNNYNITEAINYLCKEFNIEFIRSKWAKNQKEKYIFNFNFINDYKNIKENYPNSYRLIYRYFIVLTQINSIGLTNIYKEDFSVETENVFYMSNRYLGELLGRGKSIQKINKYINLFCTLGLLNKIKLENVPLELRERAKAERTSKKELICFYTINNYFDIAPDAEKIAKKLVEQSFSITPMSYEYLKRLLGGEFANKIYEIRNKASKETKSLEEVIQSNIMYNIKECGYFQFDMIKKKKVYYRYKYIDSNTKKRIFKRILPELLKKHNLVYKKANSHDVEKYKLKSCVYIITK